MKQDLLADAKMAFFDAMCHSNPFDELMRAAYKLLGWPILVGDNSANVLIQIPDSPIDSVWYNALLDDPRVHPELFPQFQNAMHRIYNPDSNPIQVIPGENQQYPLQICMTVRLSNQLVAQIYFHVPKEKVSEEEMQVLKLLLRAVTAECVKTHRWKPLESMRRQHQMRLLLQGDKPKDILQGHAEDLESSLHGGYRVLVTLLEADTRQEDFIPFYMNYLEKLSEHILNIAYGGNIVTLAGELSDEETGKIIGFMRSCSVTIGRSRTFSGSLLQLNTMYQQALLTARLGRSIEPEKLVFDFEELTPLQVFVPALQQYHLKTFLHPYIVSVIDYDQMHGTEYLKTLQAHLLSGRSNRKSIQLLAVHQNTLLYRLSKIREIFGIDFQDERLVQTLLCNIQLLEVARPDLLSLLQIDPPNADSEVQ